MIKSWLNYFLNLRNKVFESRLLIFLLGVIFGALIDFKGFIGAIPNLVWAISSVGLMIASYFFYVKYKINQDTFGDF